MSQDIIVKLHSGSIDVESPAVSLHAQVYHRAIGSPSKTGLVGPIVFACCISALKRLVAGRLVCRWREHFAG
jgi:hypothetical protein